MNYLKTVLTYIFLFLSISSYSWEQQVINFEPSTYEGGTQNWQIKENNKGWLYFANNNGLLEFDGYNWALYPMKNKIVRTIVLDDKIIYAGGNNMFGYYKKNSNGILEFISLSEKIDTKWKGNIWDIYHIKDKVYYIDDHNIYVFDNHFDHIGTYTSNDKIDCTLLLNDIIYLGNSNRIMAFNSQNNKITETKFTNLSSRTNNSQFKIVEILSYKGEFIIVTANSGIYITKKNDIEKLSTVGDSFIINNQLFQASLQNDLLAIGSVQNGLLMIDLSKPNYFEIINQSNGLNNNTILCSFFDSNKNLWVGLDNGITFINLDRAISPLFSKESPIGTGYCSAIYNNQIYLGTNQGLYTLNKNSSKIEPIIEAKGQIISLITIHNTLFSCGDNNLFIVDNNRMYSINIPGFMGVYPIEKRDDILIATTYFGLKLLRKDKDKWIVSHNIEGLDVGCKSGLTHYKNNEYWQANPDDDFINKLSFDKDFKTVNVKPYSLGENRIMNNSFINIIDFNAVVCTTNGLYRYSSDEDKFIPYQELENLLDGNRPYEYLFIDKNKDIWYKINEALFFLPYSNNRVDLLKFYIGFESQMVDGAENITVLDSSQVIIGTYKGFTLVNTNVIQNQEFSFDISLRWIKTVKDGIGTSYNKSDKDIILPYGNNTVSFAWGGHNSSSLGEIYFSYRLIGLDKEWSVPSRNHLKEYTNLSEGSYTFEVRTSIKDKNHEQISYDQISFVIQPPWFRSVWAYIVYIVLIMIFLFFLYKQTIRKQKREIKEQQRHIEYQQLLLEEETRIKELKIKELEKEKLKTDLQFKSHETTGYILNIKRKNEMFDRILSESSNILKLIDSRSNIQTIRKKISLLVQDINNNIRRDDDFDSFKSNFDFAHKDFFKILEQKHPQLTQKDKILCAYIKMNYVSKEIAPLLNISVRGVEINRYNLRKKMGLDRNTNLSEYLNSLIND